MILQFKLKNQNKCKNSLSIFSQNTLPIFEKIKQRIRNKKMNKVLSLDQLQNSKTVTFRVKLWYYYK